MKVVFFYSELKQREIELLDSLKRGCERHGDTVEGIPASEYHVVRDADVAGIFGVKGNSRLLLEQYKKVGIRTLYIDKGYTRCCKKGREFYKLVVDGFNRSDLGTLNMPDDRLKRLGTIPKPYMRITSSSSPVIIAGSSAKFHEFAGMREPTQYTANLIRQIRQTVPNPIVYRPKPSWKDAVELDGARYSRPPQTLQDLFDEKPLALITYGSNAGVDAMFAGIPVVSLTDLCVTANISSTSLSDMLTGLKVPSERERHRWLSDLAYQQWAVKEIGSGLAWDYIRQSLR